jgi:PiT family inorganic phosphate transporter
MISLLGGVFLGWSLGANDASNVFGSAVASKMLRFWTAAILASVFVLIGALLQGQAGIETLKGLTQFTLEQAIVCSVAAATTVTIMTLLGLPVSTSQAVVGAILGIGILNQQLNLSGLGKVVACWLGTPVGAVIIAIVIYRVLAVFYNRLQITLFQSDILIRVSMIAAGSYGAYALGANNVANVTAVFVGLGILTLSKPVMETVGKKLVRLDPFSALVVLLAQSITVHIYTFIGVPVSTSQAVIGAVLGVGIVKGINTVRTRTLVNIIIAWILTPAIAGFFATALDFAIHLHYVPHH